MRPDSPLPVRKWVTLPNLITLMRLALVLPIAILIVQDVYPVLTVVLLVGFGASDWVDGYLARRLAQTSLVGAVLDPIADRVGVGIVVGALVIAGHLHLGIILAISAVDVVLLFTYLLAHSSYVHVATVSWLGKARTAMLMAGLGVTSLALLPTFAALTSVGATLCVIGTVLHVVAGAGYLRDIALFLRLKGRCHNEQVHQG